MGCALAGEFDAHGVHQMRFAEADAAVKEERVEAGRGGLFGYAARAGISELVGFSHNETVEREPRVEWHG